MEGEIIPPEHTYAQQGNAYHQTDSHEQNNGYTQNSGAYQENGYSPSNRYNQSTSGGVNLVFGMLSYLGFLVLIPILLAPNAHFVRFHANQGLVLLMVEAVLAIFGGILGGLPFL